LLKKPSNRVPSRVIVANLDMGRECNKIDDGYSMTRERRGTKAQDLGAIHNLGGLMFTERE